MNRSTLAPSLASAQPSSPAHQQPVPEAHLPRLTAAGDVRTFILSIAVAFLVIFGGGWLLAEQMTPAVDDLLMSEVELVAKGRSRTGATVTAITAGADPVPAGSVHADTQDEWRFYIYTGAPLHEHGTDDLESARSWKARDDG
jgi:hypothetical protein